MSRDIKNIGDVADKYDAFLLDLWGVIHDGDKLYPGVADMLRTLKDKDKKVVFLSNAPRRSETVIEALDRLGIKKEWYDGVMASGEAGYQWLDEHRQNGEAPFGTKYYYLGPDKDVAVLSGLGYERVDNIKSADFLLNVGFLDEKHDINEFTGLLEEAKAKNLPMLCLNPDLEVVKQSGLRIPCAGAFAAKYEEMGGKVMSFGKPFKDVYERCMNILGEVPKDKILAVGDSLITDIRGANHFGIDCALVTGGILKKDKEAGNLPALCAKEKVEPTYIAPGFGKISQIGR